MSPLAFEIWTELARRLRQEPRGTSIRFEPSSGLVWMRRHPDDEAFISCRCHAPLEWLTE